MDDTIYEKYRRAGRIAAEAREYGLSLVKEGVTFLDVATCIETKIRSHGVGIAFPVNISINEIAAHYSPRHDDTSMFHRGDVVKLDVGVHVDGYIADTAATIEVATTKYSDLINASKKALENAIANLKNHTSFGEVGKTVEETIRSSGYTPIENLTGHSLERYVLHAGLSIPNVADNGLQNIKPKSGDVLAVEPFATNGAGHVISGEGSNIYLCQDSWKTKLIRDQRSRISLQKLGRTFNTLPFAERWCTNIIPNADSILKRLSLLGSVRHYPQLIDKKKGIVSQTEHTMIITDDGCEVIT